MASRARPTKVCWGSNICEICCEDIVDGNLRVEYMSTCGEGDSRFGLNEI
jgi:hypothetical protein